MPPSRQLHIRISEQSAQALERRAADLGIPVTTYLRGILERDGLDDPDARFVEQFTYWWGLRGQGDPQHIVGAVARARGAGMTFAHKFRMVVRMMLDHGLI